MEGDFAAQRIKPARRPPFKNDECDLLADVQISVHWSHTNLSSQKIEHPGRTPAARGETEGPLHDRQWIDTCIAEIHRTMVDQGERTQHSPESTETRVAKKRTRSEGSGSCVDDQKRPFLGSPHRDALASPWDSPKASSQSVNLQNVDSRRKNQVLCAKILTAKSTEPHIVRIQDDTGTDVNWIHPKLVERCGLERERCEAKGFRDFQGRFYRCSERVRVRWAGKDNKSIDGWFLVAPGRSTVELVLGNEFVSEYGRADKFCDAEEVSDARILISDPASTPLTLPVVLHCHWIDMGLVAPSKGFRWQFAGRFIRAQSIAHPALYPSPHRMANPATAQTIFPPIAPPIAFHPPGSGPRAYRRSRRKLLGYSLLDLHWLDIVVAATRGAAPARAFKAQTHAALIRWLLRLHSCTILDRLRGTSSELDWPVSPCASTEHDPLKAAARRDLVTKFDFTQGWAICPDYIDDCFNDLKSESVANPSQHEVGEMLWAIDLAIRETVANGEDPGKTAKRRELIMGMEITKGKEVNRDDIADFFTNATDRGTTRPYRPPPAEHESVTSAESSYGTKVFSNGSSSIHLDPTEAFQISLRSDAQKPKDDDIVMARYHDAEKNYVTSYTADRQKLRPTAPSEVEGIVRVSINGLFNTFHKVLFHVKRSIENAEVLFGKSFQSSKQNMELWNMSTRNDPPGRPMDLRGISGRSTYSASSSHSGPIGPSFAEKALDTVRALVEMENNRTHDSSYGSSSSRSGDYGG
ncbi:hypothetical protein SUNI508_10145 [Seiridium unicorne]|uniref:Uncharacterized protein n=1 Tax=Seiridium unicorne TaxID=138068 RepID=A0ABR2UN53_9PEZI